jgi:superfamily II DNA or RNA helicase
VATVQLSDTEEQLRSRVGTTVFLQARHLVEANRVARFSGGLTTGQVLGQVHDGDGGPRSTLAMVDADLDGRVKGLATACTCVAASPCRHGVAVLLAALKAHRTSAAEARHGLPDDIEPAPVVEPARWERRLAVLTAPSGPSAGSTSHLAAARVGLQFELVNGAGRSAAPMVDDVRLAMRPVTPGAKGWVRSGITWSTMSYQRYGAGEQHRRHLQLLSEIQTLQNLFDDRPSYYRPPTKLLYLDTFPSRRIWDLLAEATEAGLPLVYADRLFSPVRLCSEPAKVSVEVSTADGALVLDPMLVAGPHRVPMESSIPIGDPTHGFAWWQPSQGRRAAGTELDLRLAPVTETIDHQVRDLLLGGAITVPAPDQDRFLTEYYPQLRQRVAVVNRDDDLVLPQPAPPRLRLTVQRRPGHLVTASWDWVYTMGRILRHEPLWPDLDSDRSPAQGSERDAAGEAAVLRQVLPVVSASPAAAGSMTSGSRLVPFVELSGLAMIALLRDVLPGVQQLPDVDVVVSVDPTEAAERPEPVDPVDYVEASEPPRVTFTGDADGDRDWFDLAITVSVDGQPVPFTQLFVALAQQQDVLILDNGTYFSLDRDELRHLADLIAEARTLQDSPAGTMRLSRFQADLWSELDRVGVIAGQAAEWQRALRELVSTEVDVDRPPPATLAATLRPYQLAGFQWLAALHDLGLGGILADDMGLGKTVQTLALVCQVREQAQVRGEHGAPFLVLAPTSVVSNWKAEAARFAPELTVATITETEARRGADVSAAAQGADILVTSYTLFRLEYEQYEACDWTGMILDEAQFVKNHQSRGYQCAKKLPAPFKLAITGTPMENNLMELWSLLSITAPGLFANPTRFTEYYRTPIEKGGDAELLAQLRRRIRPLMLRRTKDQVLTDLPDKQEQILEVDLNPKHRRLYQTYLHRERQKVLGLLGDFNKNRFEIFRSLTLLRQVSLDPALVDPAHAGVSATKLDVMMEQVDDIVAEGHRVLIFSQFTRFLAAARVRLEAAGVQVCYLDGATRNRAKVINSFKTGDAPVFLISLKAGGVGLNLTEADYCIMLDPWWNPATEAQAVDRTHRIGQTKKVMVYRLVAKDTIEEKVMALKASKAALFDSVMDGEAFASVSLSASDIKGLLS